MNLPPTPDSLVDLTFIMNYIGFRKTFVYEKIKEGLLPYPIKIGSRSRWLFSDCEKLKEKLINEN